MKRLITHSFLFMILAQSVWAQEIPLTAENWNVNSRGHVFENFKGKQSLYIFQGIATLKNDIDFKTGIIEYDMYVTERRGFPGVHFRIVDNGNYEEFYIRPHQSGNPDANQYTPVYNGLSGWQLYAGEGHAAAYNYKMDAWNHIRLVIAERDAEVYINDMETPLFYIPELKREPVSGTIRLSGGGPSPFHFADLKVTVMSNPRLKSKRVGPDPLPDNIIKSWQVSNPFSENTLDKMFKLKRSFKSKLNWTEVATESEGLANLGSAAVRTNENNTVIAKAIIRSEKEQIVKLSYGFSDRVKVYLNDEIISGGADGFVSRDYRFLGTIGFFDHAYLKLKKGNNELWMAVSENFGGWGVMGGFSDMTGISFPD